METSLQTYTYRNGEKLLLLKSDHEFVVRLLPGDVESDAFRDVQQVSSASTKVLTTPGSLESNMEEVRKSAVAHHAYYSELSGDEFLISDRILVHFKEGFAEEDIDYLMANYGLRLVERFDEYEFLFQLTQHTGMNPVKLVVKLTEEEDLVALVENDLNYRAKKADFKLPTDPAYYRQWHLHMHNRSSQVDDRSSSNCEAAWKRLQGYGDRSIVIGITDDGCKLDHPDFEGSGKFRSWGYFKGIRLTVHSDFDADPNKMYQDGSNHGTACAGVSAGNVNAELTVGAAPNCRLLPIKWESSGMSLYISDSKMRTVLEYVSNKVDILSNSWGITPVSLWASGTVSRIQGLTRTGGRRGKGILFLWAAGNENCPINYQANENVPYSDGWTWQGNSWAWGGVRTSRSFRNNLAEIEGLMHVAALASNAQRSHYSNYGPGVDLCAPSSNSHAYYRKYVTGLPVVTASGSEGGINQGFGGTSSATPLVAGVAALVLSANDNLSAIELAQLLKQTASKDLNMRGYSRTPAASYDPDTSWDVSPVKPFDKGGFEDSGLEDGSWSPWFGFGKVDASEAIKRALKLAGQGEVTGMRIVSALVNPEGRDAGNEKITIQNGSDQRVSLEGWRLEVKKRSAELAGEARAPLRPERLEH